MNTFEINGVVYAAKEMNFNFMCLMEDRGIEMSEFDKKPMKIAREYFAYCAGVSSEDAGNLIEKHIIAGKDLSPLYDAMSKAMEDSGFFQALWKNGEKEVEPEKEATPKKK